MDRRALISVVVVVLVVLALGAVGLVLWQSVGPKAAQNDKLPKAAQNDKLPSAGIGPKDFPDGIGVYYFNDGKYNFLIWKKICSLHRMRLPREISPPLRSRRSR